MDDHGKYASFDISTLINNHTIIGESRGHYSKILYLQSNINNKKLAYKIFGCNVSNNDRKKEIKLHNIMKHEKIINVYHIDMYGILMEYGIPMIELNYKTMCNIYVTILQISMALEYLHVNNYVYFDLKQENVVLVQGEILSVKLIDIGSCVHENNIYINDKLNKNTKIVHSKLYCGPELIIEKYKLSAKHDMWSLGVILSELSYNCHPYMSVDMHLLDNYDSDIIYNQMAHSYAAETKIFPNNIIIDNYHYANLTDTFSIKPSEIISKLVQYDPSKRITSTELINILYDMLSPK